MSEIKVDSPIGEGNQPAENGDSVEPFASLAALWAAHRKLLERRRERGQTPALLADIELFVMRDCATGKLLDDHSDRWEAQNLLDYWLRELYQVRREVPAAALAEFDPVLAPELDDDLCPYLGLDAFGTSKHPFFFGRDELIEKMVDTLKYSRFLAIVGPSGSGKSSAALAGLLPRLQAGALHGSKKWRYFPAMVPGVNPLANLARTVQPAQAASSRWVQRTADRLLQDPAHILTLLHRAGDRPVVFIIDQFEEIFTFCNNDVLRRAFISVLLHLIETPAMRHTVILTMRTDLESNLVQLPALQTLYEQAQVRMTAMKAAELRQAITRPADLVSLKFEENLVEEIIREVLGDPAALPLLQFTLLKLWENRDRNRVTWEAYRRSGGVRHALANSADAFYDSLSPRERETARRILLTIVQSTDSTIDIARDRVPRLALYEGSAAARQVDSVLDRLIEARLVRLIQEHQSEDDQVEIAHNALVRIWPRLVGWLEEERVNQRHRRRLTTMAEQWEALGHDPSALLRGLLLEEALAYGDLSAPETAFIEASVAAAHQERLEKEAARRRELEQAHALAEVQRRRARESARSARRLSWLSTALTIVFVVAMAAALLAVRNSQVAGNNAATAMANEAIADTLRVTAEASLATAVAASDAAQAEASLRATAEADAREQRQIAESERDLAEQNALEAVRARQSAEASAREAETSAHEAETSAHEAELQSRLATARELAAAAVDQLGSDPQLSLLLALEAVNLTLSNGDSTPAEAEDALYRALQTSQLQLTLSGHTDWVGNVAFSPDGARLATASYDTTVKVWDAATGQELLDLADHSRVVNSIAFSPDGTRLASAAADGFIILWDAASGRRLGVIDNQSIPRAIAFSPDGERLAVANADSSVRVWNVRANQSLLRLFRHTASLRDVAFSPDGALFASGGEDGRVIVWQTETGTPLYSVSPQFEAGEEPVAVNGVAFSPDGRRIVTANDNGTATVWAFASDEQPFTLSGHASFIFDVTFSPNGALLATAGGDGTAKVWRADTGQALYTLSGHRGGVNAVTFSPDSLRLATAGQDGTAKIWNAEAGLNPSIFAGHSAAVLGVAFSPDGLLAATASGDQTAKVWDTTTGAVRYSFGGHNNPVNDVAFSPGGLLLASASEDWNVRLWDLVSGEVLLPFLAHEGPINSVAFSPDGALLVTAGDDATARLWDLTGGKLLAIFRHEGPVNSAVLSRDGALLATADNSGRAIVWNVASSEPVLTLTGHEGPVNDVAFHPDGTMLATAGSDGDARIWDLNSGELRRTFAGHSGAVLDVAFSPNGSRLVTSSADRTAKLWDTDSGQTRRTLLGHAASISGVAFSPDGTRLVMASLDRTAQIVELIPIDELFDRALDQVTRSLSGEECAQYLHGRECVTARP